MKNLKRVFIGVVFAFLYFPIIVIAFLSLNESSRTYKFTGFSLKWYQEIFANESLFEAITNTFLVAIASTIIATILGTLIAIGISVLKRRNKRLMLFLNNIPIMNPDIVTGLTLMIIFSWFNFQFGFQTMLISHVFFSIPFVVLSVLPRLSSIDQNLYDAALDLGCTKFQAIYKVIVPAIRTGIITGALISFTMSIDDFVISYFTTGNGFSNFSIWIYARLGRKSFSPAAYAYNTLVVAVTIIGLLVYNKILNRRGLENEKN
jgi:spermidine/putrescine transport system permease protein